MAFVQSATRYLVAVLAVELATKRLAEPKAWQDLQPALARGKISLGLWADAAIELSKSILQSPGCVLEPVAGALAVRGPGGKARASAAGEALLRLVHLRNQLAHPETPANDEARANLEQMEEPFRTFVVGLRALSRRPIWVALESHGRQGQLRVRLEDTRGADSPPAREETFAKPVDTGRPFVVAPGGDLLYLDPGIAFGDFPVDGGSLRSNELRILAGWGGGAVYEDPLGSSKPAGCQHTASAAAVVPNDRDFATWWRASCGDALLTGAIDITTAARLIDPEGHAKPPEVPNFRVGARLGLGGNGRVYEATRVGESTPLAVKLLQEVQVGDVTSNGRLAREFALLSGVRHPNLVQVFDLVPDTPAGPMIVMELVSGETLRSRVSSEPLAVDDAVDILRQVLAGLRVVHAKAIVHRDVSPENVMLDGAGGVKLIDFGIARGPDSTLLTRTHDGLGKLNFSAPEQTRDPKSVGAAADVYACGRLFGYMVTGSVEEAAQLAALPGGLQAVVARAVAERPEHRFKDATEMLAALDEALQRSGLGPPVWPGAELSPGLTVVTPERAAGEGLWFVRLRKPNGEPRLAVVAERSPEALARLRREVEALSQGDVSRLGRPEVLEGGSPPLHYVLLAVDSLPEVGGAFGTPTIVSDAKPAANRRRFVDMAPTRSDDTTRGGRIATPAVPVTPVAAEPSPRLAQASRATPTHPTAVVVDVDGGGRTEPPTVAPRAARPGWAATPRISPAAATSPPPPTTPDPAKPAASPAQTSAREAARPSAVPPAQATDGTGKRPAAVRPAPAAVVGRALWILLLAIPPAWPFLLLVWVSAQARKRRAAPRRPR